MSLMVYLLSLVSFERNCFDAITIEQSMAIKTGRLGITIEWIDSGVRYGVEITMASVDPILGALKMPYTFLPVNTRPPPNG